MLKKTATINSLLVAIALFAASPASAEASFPSFDQEYWETEKDAGTGKIWRGVGGTVLGLGAMIPSAIWLDKAFDNPHKFAALGVVASIASISIALHGINSIVFGKEQRDKANYFINRYKNNPQSVSAQEERDFYLYAEKKTTAKLVAFGSVLSVQSFMLFTNGIVLGIRKGRGHNIGGAKLWPSFVFGGLMLFAGVALIVKNARYYRDLHNLELQPIPSAQALRIQPWFHIDPLTGASSFGLSGQVSF